MPMSFLKNSGTGISIQDVLDNVSIQNTATTIYSGNLVGVNDVNDPSTDYTFLTGSSADFSMSGNEGTFLTNSIYNINSHIEVLNATANGRGIYSLYVSLYRSGVELVRYSLGGMYIRDDGNSYDNGSMGGSVILQAQVGDTIRVHSIRLSSEDQNDDNPANNPTSFLTVQKVTSVLI